MISTIAVIAGTVEMLLVYRAAQMRALAKQLGWSYVACNNHVWKLIFKHKTYPSDFWLRNSPMTAMWGTMNVIEGTRGGIRIIVLDSLLHFGARSDRYVTFIGAKTETDPFLFRSGKEKIARSDGWFALYRIRLSVLTWSLSVKRIEEHLRAISG